MSRIGNYDDYELNTTVAQPLSLSIESEALIRTNYTGSLYTSKTYILLLIDFRTETIRKCCHVPSTPYAAVSNHVGTIFVPRLPLQCRLSRGNYLGKRFRRFKRQIKKEEKSM